MLVEAGIAVGDIIGRNIDAALASTLTSEEFGELTPYSQRARAAAIGLALEGIIEDISGTIEDAIMAPLESLVESLEAAGRWFREGLDWLRGTLFGCDM